MSNLKQILVTLVIVAFTFLNIYKLEMPVPVDDIEYRAYANNYLMLTGICFILISAAFMAKERNRVTDSLLMVNIGAYSVLTVKAFFNVADHHSFYDWTYIGIAVISAILYLLPNKTKHKKNE